MKIKTKVYLVFIVYLILVIILGNALFFTTHQMVHSIEKSEISRKLVQQLFYLSILTSDYISYQSERAGEQWQNAYQSLGDIFTHIFADPEEIDHTYSDEEVALLHKLQADYKVVGELFPQVIQSEISEDLHDRLVSQTFINLQEMVANSFKMFQISQSTILKAQERDNLFNLIFLTAMLILMLFGFYSLVSSTLMPMKKMMKGTKKIGKGDLKHKIEITSRDEFGDLAAAFNQMTANLQETMASRDDLNREIAERKLAQEKIEQLSKFPAENPYPVLRISDEGVVQYHNIASNPLLRQWHYQAGKKIPDEWFQYVNDSLKDNSLKKAEIDVGDEVISVTFAPIPEKGFVNVYGSDITERKQIEQELRIYQVHLEEIVKERTEELLASNKELEAFAYSVSHDLRAPLRAIDGFTRILLEDYVDNLDVEAKRLGSIIQKNSQKMGQLIDDLLAFSRLGRASMHFSSIDMKGMVNEIYTQSTTSTERERISFSLADLPKANGDPNMLRQVWVNLISNALKFSAKQEQAKIWVTCQEDGKALTYCVKDNGAGFNMKYIDKLFGVFHRLHSEKEFPGTGVGLALVKRIIQRHDGKIWAEGELGKGAAFYFSLPKIDKNNSKQ